MPRADARAWCGVCDVPSPAGTRDVTRDVTERVTLITPRMEPAFDHVEELIHSKPVQFPSLSENCYEFQTKIFRLSHHKFTEFEKCVILAQRRLNSTSIPISQFTKLLCPE